MFDPLADLELHAAQRPDAVALATPRRSYTFAQLLEASGAVSARLREAGVTTNSLVGIDLPTALEWIVTLGLFRLAARTVSLRGVRDTSGVELDVLLAEPGLLTARAPLGLEIDELWIDSAVGAGLDPAPITHFESDESIFRLILTSGTTGVPRAAAYSVGALRYRASTQHVHWTDGRPELTLIGLSTTGGFHAAVACLRLGVAYLAVDRIDNESLTFASLRHIRVLCGSPTQVALATQVMLEAGITLPQLEQIRLAGAGPSVALLHLLSETFGVPVVGVYGSTEGGGISMLELDPAGDRFAVGAALADVELEIIDDDGQPVPNGTEGRIRYRNPGLVSGYVSDGVVVPFADGWFVPGDRATLDDDGMLVLGGRESELLNLGGVKIDPVRIDELAAAFDRVTDAAAFGLERTPGILEVGLAVVGDCDLRELDRALRSALAVGFPTAFWRVAEIPRNRLGKPMRSALAEGHARLRATDTP